MTFPTLYGKPSKGDKIKQWSVSVEPKDNYFIIIRKHGFIGFKETESVLEVKQGKNIGKKNETTRYTQAISQATAMWTKQKEQGYVEDKDELERGVKFLPMLAHDFTKRGKDIKSPFYIQPKLDGVRMSINKGEIISRTGKPYVGFEHIKKAVKKLKLSDTIHLDGELFTTELDFETLCSVCRKSKVVDERQEIMKFYIFDFFDTTRPDMTFEKRYFELAKMRTKFGDSLVLVDSSLCDNFDKIDDIHESIVNSGHEGIMLRNRDGKYKPNHRSIDLQKYKTFEDSEYEIVGCSEAVGNDKGTVIFSCLEPKSGTTFSVRPKGSREQRKEWFDNFEKYKGKMLTVKYQNLSADGIPRFPVGMSIRDYE